MEYIILVGKDDKVRPSFFKNIEFIKLKNILGEETSLEKETYNAYLELQEYLAKKDISIGVLSAYQAHSEYQTGLAFDIVVLNNDEETKLQMIHSVLHDFGFILRYPKNKENITGFPYNPSHIRYVGRVPARIIFENDLTLEEYLRNFSCVLAINKPQGITSFDVVKEISHIYGIKRVGHTGTLDPMAEGVMLVAVGQATKIVELLTAHDKEYIAGVELGYQTDTYDNTGLVLHEKEVPKNISIEQTLQSFQKTYLQEVPIYSAIKVKGKKLYEYARSGEEVVLPKKEVTIKEIELLKEKDDTFTFRALVTKGCYIRSLINDIGLSLNTYATMTRLIRTKQGKISIEDTNTLEEVRDGKAKEYRIEEILDYPVIQVKEEESFILNGVKVPNKWMIKDKVIFKNRENKLLGIYEREEELLKVWKNFT